MTKQGRVLVTGATGNIGRHVVAGLVATGANVRAMVRDPETSDLPPGVEVVRGDLTDSSALNGVTDGVDAVFLLWPFLSAEAAPAAVEVFARHARRIVYVSAMSVRDDRNPLDNGVWGQVEHAIRQSAREWTFLRAGGLATNTLAWADQIRTDRVVRWPCGHAARSLIHERDIAAVAVRALTEDGHVGAKYVLTGPEVLTQAEQVRIIGEAIGRPVRWEELSREQARQQMLATLGDPDFVDGALDYWTTLIAHPEPVSPTVEQVTGTPARTFREWAIEHAADFRPLSVAEIANRYVSAFRRGRLDLALQLMSTDVVRVAPMETAGQPVELRGIGAIMDNSRRLNADFDIHHVEVEGPFMASDRFAVRFTFDETHTPTARRATTTKMSVYTIADSKIAREEVFYYDPPPLSRAGMTRPLPQVTQGS